MPVSPRPRFRAKMLCAGTLDFRITRAPDDKDSATLLFSCHEPAFKLHAHAKKSVGRFCLGPVPARLPEPENAGRGIFRRADPDRASGNGAASAVIGFGYSFDFRYLTVGCGAASETKTRSAGPGSFVLRRSANGPAAFLSEAAHPVAERFRKTKKRSPCRKKLSCFSCRRSRCNSFLPASLSCS